MRHEWTSMDVAGFKSGDVDFTALLASSDQSVRDRFDTEIMSPLVNATDGAILVIAGHADRVDTGEDHRTSLGKEATASYARADSAESAVLAMIGRDWLDPPPASWDELPHLAVYKEGRGAIALLNDGGDEAARRANRRVTFMVCRFIP